ncbi:RT0821/Lpp0805 family surface protein [Terrarubrum flagellatum]|uniref:RT0821/Lpp0805 family surface protein n=1 Tax=Terrirubrum flagellatum TaxID=2895980 RepID=UPI0031452957
MLWSAVAVAAGLVVSGCSISFSPMSLFSSDDDVVTGSIPAKNPAPKSPSPLSPEHSAEDWRRAQAALATALDPQGNGASVGWDNPESKMKGSISPVGGAYVKDDQVCRAFLATNVTPGGQDWMQGSACKPSGGEWLVRDVKPWKKPA